MLSFEAGLCCMNLWHICTFFLPHCLSIILYRELSNENFFNFAIVHSCLWITLSYNYSFFPSSSHPSWAGVALYLNLRNWTELVKAPMALCVSIINLSVSQFFSFRYLWNCMIVKIIYSKSSGEWVLEPNRCVMVGLYKFQGVVMQH